MCFGRIIGVASIYVFMLQRKPTVADDYWPISSYTGVPLVLLSMMSWIGMHCGYVALCMKGLA